MDVTVTVVDAETGARTDARSAVPDDTPAAAVVDGLRSAVGPRRPARPVAVGGLPLDETGTAGELGLVDGVVVVVGAGDHGGSSPPPVAPTVATAVTPLPDGHLLLTRRPRLRPAPVAESVEFPAAPVEAAPVRLPVLAAVAPLVAGLVLAVVLHQWQYLAFTVLSPVMVVGQAASDRWAARRSRRAGRRRYDGAMRVARASLAAALERESARRHLAAPDPGVLARAALQRTDRLWDRSIEADDGLLLRLGLGDLRSAVAVSGGPGEAWARSVPVTVDLRVAGTLGVTGSRNPCLGLVRALVVQAATLLGSSQLDIVVLAPGQCEQWSWTRWLPHLVPARGQGCTALLGLDPAQTAARLAELTSASDRGPALVVVDATPTGAMPPEARHAVAALPDSCVVIWLAGEAEGLPSTCRAVAHLDGSPQLRLRLSRHGEDDLDDVVPDVVSREVAEAVARSLAPLRDAGAAAATAMPPVARWADVARLDLASADAAARDLARRWSVGPTTTITLGRTATGSCVVDLGRDGPHALVAGTTGSGKSELLRGMVAGLAAGNRPDQLSLLLIDYKGGAAFGPCMRLPHTIGVLTDLDGASTARALTSLTAELRRREAALAEVGAADLDGYTRAARSRGRVGQAPPRLVILVDEFATLADELPDFVGGLVGIAQRGRSLGVHLVLATQRPEGVVSADIRANMRLRICLAVARESESRDVIDGPHAARIDHRNPGRAFLRAGPDDPREFQAAHVGRPRATTHDEAVVTLSPARALGRPPVDTAAAGGPTDLDVLVEAANRLSDTLGCAPGAPIWLPPLPDRVRLSDLPERLGTTVAWGLVDQPAEQRQQPLELDLASGGSMLLAGMARSGRTTAAVALATAAAARLGPDDFHLWAVDAGGGLADLARLPHCGAVVPVTDLDRLDRLIGHVNKEVTRRRAARGHAGAAMMLVLDSWEGFVGAAGDSDGGRRVDAVLRLAAEGPAARLRLLVTCERAGLTGRLASACSDRLVLRLADRADYAMLGLPARALPTRLPPGRGLRTDDLAFAQLAEADPETTAVARGWPTAAAGARRFAPLPERVSLPSLPRGPNRKGRIVVGVGGDHVAPLGLDIDELGGSVLVAGPPRSGRSTTLAVVAEQLVAEGRQTAGSPRPVLVLCPRRSALSEVPGVTAVPTSDQQRAADILAATAGSDGSGAHVVVDDVDLLMDGPLTDRLEVLVRAATDNGSVVALAGQTDPLLAAFRGPVVEARRAGVGILLRPMSSRDGDLLGLRLPRSSGGEPPGRGWLAARGELTRVQVATPGNRPITAASRCPVAAPVALP